MNILIHILFIAMALLLLWCLMLLPRKGQSGWEKLADVRYAHRGLHDMSQNIPENSLTAFRKAVENGFAISSPPPSGAFMFMPSAFPQAVKHMIQSKNAVKRSRIFLIPINPLPGQVLNKISQLSPLKQ